mmetsp:Transcript_65744/g.140636  ORF Transcript_65744/g.140636 Transcript_65744/m.140636 type:complete len:285 (-) Transcript_65744:1563-2417(-)
MRAGQQRRAHRAASGLHRQPDEMFHEDLQRDIVGDDHRGVHPCPIARALAVVRGGRIHLGRQESRLGASRVRLDELRHREAVVKDLLCVFSGRLQQRLEVCIFLLLLVTSIVPSLDGLAFPDHDVKESVEEQNHVRLQGRGIQEHWLRRALVERVLQQGGLDHHERIHCILTKDQRAVVRSLVRARIEGLQEIAAPKVVHELREDGQLRAEVERPGLVLAVVRELGYQADEHPVYPSQDIEWILVLALEHSVPSHEHRRRLLIEAGGDVAHACVGVAVRDRCHA